MSVWESSIRVRRVPELVHEVRSDAAPGGPERVPERGGAPVQVEFRHVELQGLRAGEGLSHERFVDLYNWVV